MTVTGDTASARQLRAILRVPGDRMSDALARLRQLGVVVEDTQGSQDVSDQMVDLDARLANARATEQRLAEILKNRTGKLSDVLEVERELSRVRLEIERIDAEKTNLGRRGQLRDNRHHHHRGAQGVDRRTAVADDQASPGRARRIGKRDRQRGERAALRCCGGADARAVGIRSDRVARVEVDLPAKAGSYLTKRATRTHGLTETHGFGMNSRS